MKGVNNKITLGIGNTSHDRELGTYYQDISAAIEHITNGIYANLDKNGIPYYNLDAKPTYKPVITIQYALMCYDLLKKGIETEENTLKIKKCLKWLDDKKEHFKDSYIWRNEYNEQYDIQKGWVSGMYQGQAISFYLRAYQLFNDITYLKTAEKIFNSFDISFEEGGFKRVDENGCLWFEEYPTDKPSYVLNGFIYAMFGIFDFYRVTKRDDAKLLWDSCTHTLEININKYDVWYWSIYDQLNEQLVSYYYQRNVHIPLMQIMHRLTHNDIYLNYANKWEKNLQNPFHRFITKIMYRIQPRLKNLKLLLSK
jgi:hypothetical protein